jgi:hypothetical protein
MENRKMTLEDKIAILADLWLNFKDMEGMQNFVEYNDIGLPLAYSIDAGLSEITHDGAVYIEETYNMLAESLGLDLDEDFFTLEGMFAHIEEE